MTRAKSCYYSKSNNQHSDHNKGLSERSNYADFIEKVEKKYLSAPKRAKNVVEKQTKTKNHENITQFTD